MRPRIRSLKPEIHTDEELWDLEVATGLHIFRGFTGLWNYSDREGRFEWRPRALKAMILPYWDGDFERVLDALASRRFIVKYSVGGKQYGWVRKLKDHQAFNAREPASILPPPPDEDAHVHARAEHDSARGELELDRELISGTEGSEPRARPHVATPEPEPKPDTPPASAPANDAPTRKPQWESFPKGWRWSEATWARAVMAGVSAEQLQEHVDYWTTHDFSRPTNDLDAELVRCLARIRNGPPHGRPPARASPRTSHNPRASKQPNAGLTGFESLEKPA